MSLGIQELKKVVGLTCDLGGIAGLVLEDGKVGLDDLGHAMKLVQIFPLLSINFSQAWKEAQDYTPAEHVEMVDFIKKRLDLPQENLEATVEKVLELTKGLYASLSGLVDLVKALKAA